MNNVFVAEGWLSLVILVALLALKGFAFVNACLWPAEAYPAAGKLTKATWLAILGIGLLLQLPLLAIPFIGIISLATTVAAIVYLVDVRPAVSALSRPR